MPRPIVAGYDGSEHARWAVEWAAREAGLRLAPLRVVHAYVWPLLRIPPIFASAGPAGGLRGHAEDLLAEAVKLARSAGPETDVHAVLRTAWPAELLAAESLQASYVVVGSRGLGAVGRLLAGSVTTELAVRARCPMVLIAHPVTKPNDYAPVVAGVDGSAHSEAALETAIDLARHWNARLQIVHVVPALRPGQRVAVERAVEPWLNKYPGIAADVAIVQGHPGGVLVELSKSARAIVVGSHGSGGFDGMVIGSVSHSVMQHAHGPVVVVPEALR
ncbi:universal stress protein [Flindersiella endophytica]